MRLNTILTVYHANELHTENPLIQVHMVTTDDDAAESAFKSLVARAVSEGWDVVQRGHQTELLKVDRERVRTERLIIRHDFKTGPVQFTHGKLS